MQKRQSLKDNRGFTMVEMIVVMMIIAVLVAGGIYFYKGYINNARVTKAKAEISIIQATLDAYYAENLCYPAENELLQIGIDPGETETDNELGIKDPWGGFYHYSLKPETTTEDYELKTQCLEGQEYYVSGKGVNGSSSAPTLEKRVES